MRNNELSGMEHNAQPGMLSLPSPSCCSPAEPKEQCWQLWPRLQGHSCLTAVPCERGTLPKPGNSLWCKAGLSRARLCSSPKRELQFTFLPPKHSKHFLTTPTNPGSPGAQVCSPVSPPWLDSESRSSRVPPALPSLLPRNCFGASLVCQLVSL